MKKFFVWNLLLLGLYLVLDLLSVLSENSMSEGTSEIITMALFLSFFLILIQINLSLMPAAKRKLAKFSTSLMISVLGIIIYWAATYTLNWYFLYPYIVSNGLFTIR